MNADKARNIDVAVYTERRHCFSRNRASWILPTGDRSSTGSLLVQAVVENKTRLLKPGQYVKVRFKTEEIANAVMVPQEAINQMQNVYMAFLLDDSSKIKPGPVNAGRRVGSNWIINDGLKAGDKVALLGNALIKPGIVVKPILKPYSYDSTTVK